MKKLIRLSTVPQELSIDTKQNLKKNDHNDSFTDSNEDHRTIVQINENWSFLKTKFLKKDLGDFDQHY
jgi:hypothetical protein